MGLKYSLLRTWRQMNPPTDIERHSRKHKRQNDQHASQSETQPMTVPSDAPSPNAVNPGDGNQPSNRKDRKEIAVWEQRIIAWSELILALAIAIAAYAQVAVGKWQWEVMESGTRQTGDALAISQSQARPVIAVTDLKIHTPVMPNQRVFCDLTIKNSGSDYTTVKSIKAKSLLLPRESGNMDLEYFKDKYMRGVPDFKCNFGIPAHGEQRVFRRVYEGIALGDTDHAADANRSKAWFLVIKLEYTTQYGCKDISYSLWRIYGSGLRPTHVVMNVNFGEVQNGSDGD